MKKKKIKKNENGNMVINMNELALNQRKFTTSEIGRGIGVQKPKKGKGSYNRNNKHKTNYREDS